MTAIHPGSETARHFSGIAGLTGGAASVVIAGEVVDGKTKKVLFTFAQETSQRREQRQHLQRRPRRR